MTPLSRRLIDITINIVILHSRFFNAFKDFVDYSNLKLTDINRLNDVFTYCNDAGTATSWIDHVVCSSTVTVTEFHS